MGVSPSKWATRLSFPRYRWFLATLESALDDLPQVGPGRRDDHTMASPMVVRGVKYLQVLGIWFFSLWENSEWHIRRVDLSFVKWSRFLVKIGSGKFLWDLDTRRKVLKIILLWTRGFPFYPINHPKNTLQSLPYPNKRKTNLKLQVSSNIRIPLTHEYLYPIKPERTVLPKSSWKTSHRTENKNCKEK